MSATEQLAELPVPANNSLRQTEAIARWRLRIGLVLAVLAVLVAQISHFYRSNSDAPKPSVALIATMADRIITSVQSWAQGTHDEDQGLIVLAGIVIPVFALMLGVCVWFAAFPFVEMVSLAIRYIAFRSRVDRNRWLAGTYALCNKGPILLPAAGLIWWAMK
jgi:hypothetical protein